MNNLLFIWLSKILYPNGRAFRMPEPMDTAVEYVTEDSADEYTEETGVDEYIAEDSPTSTGGIFYRLHRALSVSFKKAWDDLHSIQDAQLPDNPNFTIADARDWYRRLGIYDSGTVSLADMKLAIAQRMSWPVTPLDKQHYQYIEDQLQAAGFNVYVKENRWPAFGTYHTVTPGMILAGPWGLAHYGAVKYGQTNYGTPASAGGVTIIANYIEEAKDAGFVVAPNYRSTFFVGAAGLTESLADFATVPIGRKDEFRQLLIKLKALHAVGFLFVNYT